MGLQLSLIINNCAGHVAPFRRVTASPTPLHLQNTIYRFLNDHPNKHNIDIACQCNSGKRAACTPLSLTGLYGGCHNWDHLELHLDFITQKEATLYLR